MKKVLGALASFSAVLLLAACGGSSAPSKTDNQALVQNTAAAAQGSGAFGAALATTDGAAFTLSTPASFTPGHFASGQLPGQTYVAFNISVTPKVDLNLSAMTVTATTPSGACADILDGDNAIQGAPPTAIPAGTTTSFKWALSCPGKSGDALTVLLSNNNVSLVQALGKLA
jgi:hypothetical protein